MVKHILIAEDDEDDLELFKEAIKKAGLPLELTCVIQCDDVLSYILKDNLPNLIILDNSLPGKSSVECITAIRSTFKPAELPVVILSTIIHPNTRVQGYIAGVNLMVEKPNAFNEIQELFKKLYEINWKENPVLTTEEFSAL